MLKEVLETGTVGLKWLLRMGICHVLHLGNTILGFMYSAANSPLIVKCFSPHGNNYLYDR